MVARYADGDVSLAVGHHGEVYLNGGSRPSPSRRIGSAGVAPEVIRDVLLPASPDRIGQGVRFSVDIL